MSEPWKCPEKGCRKVIERDDGTYLRVAVASHMKVHGKEAPGALRTSQSASGGRGRSDGWVDTVAEVVGDVVEGTVGALLRIFD